jgi:hypothetical protein
VCEQQQQWHSESGGLCEVDEEYIPPQDSEAGLKVGHTLPQDSKAGLKVGHTLPQDSEEDPYLNSPDGEVAFPLAWKEERSVGKMPMRGPLVLMPQLPAKWGALGVLTEVVTDDEEVLVPWWQVSPLPMFTLDDQLFEALPDLGVFRPYYLLNDGVEYVGRPDAPMAPHRASLARLYRQIEGVPTYANEQQDLLEALQRVQIPLGEYGSTTGRLAPVSYYNFPSLRLWKEYNNELGAYYSQLKKRSVPRALGGVTFSEGSGVRFRYPEIFTLEQCRLQQARGVG